MTTTVIKSLGTASRDYSTLQAWEDQSPTDLTLTRANTAQAGSTSSTIVLDAGASATNDFYKSLVVWANARPTEKRLITAYNGTTKVATIGALNGSSATWDNIPTAEAFTVDSVIWRGEAYNDSEFTAEVVISGQTTNSTCYVEATVAAGHSICDHADIRTLPLRYDQTKGVGLALSTGFVDAFAPSVAFTRISRWQAKVSGNHTFALETGLADITVENCIFTKDNTAGQIVSGTTGLVMKNCIFLTTGGGVTLGGYSGNGAVMHHCALIRLGAASGTALIHGPHTGTLGKIYNCSIFGFATLVNIAARFSNFDYCCTDLTSPGIASEVGSLFSKILANQYENVTSLAAGDWRAKAGADLLGAGSSGISGTPPNDITGLVRANPPTIGAWEAASSGGTVVLMGQGII